MILGWVRAPKPERRNVKTAGTEINGQIIRINQKLVDKIGSLEVDINSSLGGKMPV